MEENSNAKRNAVLKHIAYWVTLLIIIGVEFSYREPLIEWSKRAMMTIQVNETEFSKYLFIGISLIGLGAPYFLAALLIMKGNAERGIAFYHLLFLCAAIYIMNLSKMVYSESRIYWWVGAITPDECPTDFGNPSGHTMLAIGYPMVLYLHIFEDAKIQERLSGRFPWYQALCLFFVFSWSFIVGAARLYVRVHSMN